MDIVTARSVLNQLNEHSTNDSIQYEVVGFNNIYMIRASLQFDFTVVRRRSPDGVLIGTDVQLHRAGWADTQGIQIPYVGTNISDDILKWSQDSYRKVLGTYGEGIADHA